MQGTAASLFCCRQEAMLSLGDVSSRQRRKQASASSWDPNHVSLSLKSRESLQTRCSSERLRYYSLTCPTCFGESSLLESLLELTEGTLIFPRRLWH